MTLSDFIENNIERLLSDWEEFAKTHLPAAGMLSPEQLRDGAEAILRAVAADMRTLQSDDDQIQKSRGLRPTHAPSVTETGKAHAADRFSTGFTLNQLVSEYRGLRASVIRHWTMEMDESNRRQLNELVRFNEALDQSLTEAIRWFDRGAERSRDLFLGILGHDLRDPLSTAASATELQLLTRDDEDAHREATEKVRRSLDRMEGMIQDLLDFARTRLGSPIPLAAERTDLKEICREVVDAFELSHRGHEISLQCSGDLTGMWDADRIHQLLANLIKNALEHGSSDKPVAVTAQGEAEEILLSVHNAGVPIPPETRYTIFEPLTRADIGTDPRAAGGLGLGLYIIKQIAKAHAAEVKITSTAGEGTTFTVRLPRSPGRGGEVTQGAARREPFLR